MKKTLTAFCLAGLLSLAGCGPITVEIKNESRSLNESYYSRSLTDSAYIPTQDFNGDGLLDIKMVLRKNTTLFEKEYIFYKPNLGDGKFGEPVFLCKIQSYEPPYEMPIRKTERGKYLMKLMNEADSQK